MMTLLQLQVFLMVANAGSFTKAADALHLTQSAVSQAISNLEKELGVVLLNRSRQGITMTHIGERMLAHVREILRHTNCMEQEARAASGLAGGTLRIASMPSVSAKILPGILASFRSRYPHVQTNVHEGSFEEVQNWITSHGVDVGIMTQPRAELDFIALTQSQSRVFLPPNHPLECDTAISLEQIYQEPMILSKLSSEHGILEAFRQRGLTPNIQFEIRDTATILSMVQGGMGIAILSEMSIPMNISTVNSIVLTPSVQQTIGLAVQKLDEVSPICADFLLHAQEYVELQRIKS